MKRIYTVLIALASLLFGFALSSFYSASVAPLPSPTTFSFNSNTSALRMIKGTKQANDNYYLNILTYAADSITVTGIDSFNSKQGMNIAYNGGNYLFTATHGTIDTIPRAVFSTVSALAMGWRRCILMLERIADWFSGHMIRRTATPKMTSTQP